MKFSQTPENFRVNAKGYIEERAMLARNAVRESRDRILGYIFGLNAGALVGAATYAAAGRPINCLIWIAIVLWGIGLGASVIRATLDYYVCQRDHDSFFRDLKNFYADEIEWDQLVAKGKAPFPQWPFHTIGVLSGVCFFLGLISGFGGIMLIGLAAN